MAQLLKEGQAMGKGLSFEKLYGRNMNVAQQAEYDAYLADTKELVEWALAQGIILNPDSLLFKQLIKLDHDLFSMDNANSHIYVKVEDDGSIKVGVAGHGGNRVWYYIKKADEKGLPDPELRSIIDVDNIPEPVQRELVRRVLAIAAKYMCKEFPTSLRKLFACDMLGLPIGAQLFFRSIVKNAGECSVIGGGQDVWGFLRRAVINMLEDGMQIWLLERVRRGFAINDEFSLHESVNSKVMSRYVTMDSKVRSNAAACMKAIHTKKERTRAGAESHEVDAVVLAWPPGRLASCPPKYMEAKKCASNHVFGAHIPVVEPFEHPPVPNPQNIDQCFDTTPYNTRPQLKRALKRTVARFCSLERNGGYGAFDVCKTLWEKTKSGSMVDYLVRERATVLDHAPGSGWYVAWTTTGIVVLKLEYDGDDFIRIIVIFIPWCNMIFSKGDAEITWKRLRAQEKSVLSAHFAYHFFKLLREEDSTLVPDDSLDRPVEQDILAIWYICLDDLEFRHLHKKTVGLKFKDTLFGSERNAFDPSFTNMLLKTHSRGLVGTCARRLVARLDGYALEEGEVQPLHIRRDNKFVHYVLCKGSFNCKTLDDVARRMVDCLEDDRHEHGQEQVDLASSRHGIIMQKTEIIHPALLRRFDAIYQSTRQNRGNRAVIRNIALPDAIEDVNEMLTWIVNNSEPGAPVKFFVQGDGAAKKGSPTCGKYGGMEGMPFVLPEDGTIIPPEHPGGESVVFRRANFLPGLSFGGVRTRCKGTHGAGKTKKKKAVKFLDHKVDFNRDIFRFSDEKPTYMNEFRVAQVWFVPK